MRLGPKVPLTPQDTVSKKKRIPVDTVALKKSIDHDDDMGDLDLSLAARQKRGSGEESRFTNSAAERMIGASRSRATLDSARTGKIPVKKGDR